MLQLRIGQVFHLWCNVCNPPWNKFHVLAQIDPLPRYFLINTYPSPFQAARPHLLANLVPLKQAAHRGFLSHDSFLDCTDLLGGYTASDLEDKFAQDPAVLVGALSAPAMAAARLVIENSQLLRASEIEALLRSWPA